MLARFAGSPRRSRHGPQHCPRLPRHPATGDAQADPQAQRSAWQTPPTGENGRKTRVSADCKVPAQTGRPLNFRNASATEVKNPVQCAREDVAIPRRSAARTCLRLLILRAAGTDNRPLFRGRRVTLLKGQRSSDFGPSGHRRSFPIDHPNLLRGPPGHCVHQGPWLAPSQSGHSRLCLPHRTGWRPA